MTDPAFNLAMAARVGESWYTHLPAIEAAMAEQNRIDRIRYAAGWTFDEGGWASPCGIPESDWEHEYGWPLPEDPDFAEWFTTSHHYDALDADTEPVPYPNAEPGFRPPSAT